MNIENEHKIRIESFCNHALRDKRFAQENPTRIKDEIGWLIRRLAEPDLSEKDRVWCQEMLQELRDISLVPDSFLGGTGSNFQ
jgi:hypothetical protein